VGGEVLMEALKVIVYGQSGAGKTVFLGSTNDCEELQPVLLIDFESGTLSIKSKIHKIDDIKQEPEPGKISSIKIKSWADFNPIIDYLYSEFNVYKTVLVDSITEVNTMNLTTVVEKNMKNAGMATLQDYGLSGAQMRVLIRELRDLSDEGINVFISALAQTTKDEITGAVSTLPSLTGKLAAEIPALFDIVGYLQIDKDGKREMLFQTVGRILAKDRTEGGMLGDNMINPTVKKMLELISKEDK
jgi:hypothetical protein